MQRRQPFGIGDDAFVEVTTVDVQGTLLMRDRIGDIRVAVPDRGHIVVEVDITPASLVEDIRALPPHQLDRMTVEQFRTGPE